MRRLSVGVVAMGIACGSDDEGVATASSGSAASSSGSAGADESATDAATGSLTAGDSTSASGVDSAATSSADDGPLSEGGDDGPTPDVGSCDFETTVCEIADGSKRPAVDCGFVTIADDIFAWQAAHDCAWAALQSQGAFKVLWQPMAVDSLAYWALVGVVGESYAITYVSYDDYQGDVQLISWPCEEVEVDCVVAVGQMCLHPLGGGDTTVICR